MVSQQDPNQRRYKGCTWWQVGGRCKTGYDIQFWQRKGHTLKGKESFGIEDLRPFAILSDEVSKVSKSRPGMAAV